jgi:hypothetical protein
VLQITVRDERVHVGDRFSMSFQRTLRVPDDGKQYPLPPGLGKFPIESVDQFADRVPQAWQGENTFFIPMRQSEALWLGFDGAEWKPNAVQIGIGQINAITGAQWNERLAAAPQNYIVTPEQPWLDGIKTGTGSIRQFVAIPLGLGYTIEAQVSGKEEFGGIQIVVYEPKPGRFSDQAPPRPLKGSCGRPAMRMGLGMGLGAGGQVRQRIYPDSYGVDAWDRDNCGRVTVYIANSEQYRQITEREPPPTLVSAKTYTEYGLPWFDLYDEAKGDLATTARLERIKSIGQLNLESGAPPEPADESVNVADTMVRKLHIPAAAQTTGEDE